MKRILDNAFTVGVVLLGAFVLFRVFSPMLFPAEKPSVFADAITLPAALEQSKATGKPVFAVASASWCGPCQSYKKGALVDPKVEAWLTEHTIPVYIDVDEHSTDAQSLGVSSIPATFLLNADGQITARAQGKLSSRSLIDWLNSNTEQITAAAP